MKYIKEYKEVLHSVPKKRMAWNIHYRSYKLSGLSFNTGLLSGGKKTHDQILPFPNDSVMDRME